MPPLLQVNQLSHRYDVNLSDHTLRSVTFSVAAGHICAVVGASGSGKTTLLRLISGLIDADQGTVHLSGQQVTGPSQNLVPGHPDIRTVFQDFALAPNLNVYHNIAHPMRAYRRDYREARTHELIARLQLQGRENQLPATLSGGEKQRVALARALAEEPPLLLLDEPFSQVDPPLKNHLMNEVIDILRETSGTALFVTHDARDALAWSDQVVVLREGALVQQGTPQQIYEQPTDAYVAQLMGACCIITMHVWRQWFPDFITGNATLVGIRPMHISWLEQNEEGISGKVVRCNYRGGYYELTLWADETMLIVYRLEEIVVGTPVIVRINKDRAILFVG